jgi:hypothetical protein
MRPSWCHDDDGVKFPGQWSLPVAPRGRRSWQGPRRPGVLLVFASWRHWNTSLPRRVLNVHWPVYGLRRTLYVRAAASSSGSARRRVLYVKRGPRGHHRRPSRCMYVKARPDVHHVSHRSVVPVPASGCPQVAVTSLRPKTRSRCLGRPGCFVSAPAGPTGRHGIGPLRAAAA